MSANVQAIETRPRRSPLIWVIPIQVAAAFTVWAIAAGGQALRGWVFAALVWLMALPLFVSLEASLVAMMLFEPLRGIIRRGQYLFLEYNSQDPIHVLTPIVTAFAFITLLRSKRLNIFWDTPMAVPVSMLAGVYVLEIFNPLQSGLLVGLSGAMFTLTPLVWFYFGQYATEKFVTRALRLVVVVGLVTSLYGVYQLVFGYPAFEQYWISNTDFYTSIAVGNVERALATFCSAEEWARYAEIGSIAAFGFAAAQKRTVVRIGWFLAGAALIGFVVLTGQRAAIFGLGAGLVVLFMLGARRLPSAIARAVLLLIPLILVAAFMKAPDEEDMFANDETQTVSTVLSHTQRGLLKPADEESLQVRLENWRYLLIDIVPYQPLGMGIGAGTLSQWRFNQSTGDLPPVDSTIVLHALTCGIPGLLLFVFIISRGTWLSIRVARISLPKRAGNTQRILAAIMCAIALNTMFGLTFTLYSAAPLAWLFLGWISAETLRARQASEREIITI